jgi:hypothetical protein
MPDLMPRGQEMQACVEMLYLWAEGLARLVAITPERWRRCEVAGMSEVHGEQ